MKTYTMFLKMCEGIIEPRFSFEAKNDEDAEQKRFEWAEYHSFSRGDVTIRPATENEKANWLHNEHVS